MDTIYQVIEKIGGNYFSVTALRNVAVELYTTPLWTELTPEQKAIVKTIKDAMDLYTEDLAEIDHQMEAVTKIVHPAQHGVDVKTAVSSLRGALKWDADQRMKNAIYALDTDKAALDGLLGDSFVPVSLQPTLIRRVLKMHQPSTPEAADPADVEDGYAEVGLHIPEDDAVGE